VVNRGAGRAKECRWERGKSERERGETVKAERQKERKEKQERVKSIERDRAFTAKRK